MNVDFMLKFTFFMTFWALAVFKGTQFGEWYQTPNSNASVKEFGEPPSAVNAV